MRNRRRAALGAAMALLLCWSAGPAAAFVDPGDQGSLAVATTTSGLSHPGYRSAKIWYPADGQAYAPLILTGGLTNTKENMEWLAERLASHGFIVLGFTPTNTMGTPPVWERGFAGGLDILDRVSADEEHPLFGRISPVKPALVGYSMGGGGAFLLAQRNDARLGSLVLLAPFLNESFRNSIGVPTLVITGRRDVVARANAHGRPMFDALPSSTPRVYLHYQDFGHQVYHNMGSRSNHYKLSYYVTSFLKYYLADNADYGDIIYGRDKSRSEWLRPTSEFSN